MFLLNCGTGENLSLVPKNFALTAILMFHLMYFIVLLSRQSCMWKYIQLEAQVE
jgi:hypothetical protein